MPFKSLKLNDTILKALADEGYEKPTPIQAKAIPPILEGRDMLGCAQTGTGKTAAFALPIIQRLHEMDAAVDPSLPRKPPSHKHPRALILSPTRELAAQIGESFATYGRHTGLSHTVIFGGVSQFHQVKAIHRGVDVLVATPGRLIDLLQQRIVTLKDVKIFVLDEADRMLDMGFIDPIRRIASQLPRPRQTLLFSATMPREIMHLADSLLHDPVKVAVTPVASLAPLIEQSLIMVPFRQKQALLEYLLDDPAVERAVVFTKTKHGADRVCKKLNHDGVPAVAIHGNKAQNFRTRALDSFRSGKTRVLVATDVAARGLDVDDITHVFNFDLPMEPEAYVHRIGRTGRAGKTGIAVSFCDSQEHDLLRGIQKLTGKQIPLAPLPTDLPTNDHAGHVSDHRHSDRPERRDRRGGLHGEHRRSGPRGPAYGQSFGQTSYQPPQRGGSREDRRHEPRTPPQETRTVHTTPRTVVMDEHRPARAVPQHAPESRPPTPHESSHKKGHRKGQGPATNVTRKGPMSQQPQHGAGHRSDQGHGGSQGGGGGRGQRPASQGRRGGPGGGTRGKLFSRGPRQGREFPRGGR